MIDNIIKTTRLKNKVAVESGETFNKSIEIAQKYYNETAQNYLNFVKKLKKLIINTKFFLSVVCLIKSKKVTK
jgi:hypothetical protein